MSRIADMIDTLLRDASAPGLSLAVIREGRLEVARGFGVRRAPQKDPVTDSTIFQAASLSKPVVAYAALRLVDSGSVSLDEPLSRHVRNLAPGDAAADDITVRHVLSHTTGLPNWGRPERPFRTYFTPGERLSYSGEGFFGLRVMLERITGSALDVLVKRLVFDPLSMPNSSFVWRDDFAGNYASPHSVDGNPISDTKFTKAISAYSLYTTAPDYAKFLNAVLSGEGLLEGTAKQWLSPQVKVPIDRFEHLERERATLHDGIAWSLGWGLDLTTMTFFQWGANVGSVAAAFGSPQGRTAFVAFVNRDQAIPIIAQVAAQFGAVPIVCFEWLARASQIAK